MDILVFLGYGLYNFCFEHFPNGYYFTKYREVIKDYAVLMTDYKVYLSSFLLKTMERLVDRFLRDEILALQPLHPNQHAYQAGQSVETALHQLVVQVEKAPDQQGIALGVFLYIEGAFDNTSYVFSIDQTWGRPNHRTID